MHLPHIALFLVLISTSALSQSLPPNTMTSLLLETILPNNPGQTVQNVMDSVGKMVSQNLPTKVNKRYALIGNNPRTVITKDNILTQNPTKTVLIQSMDTVSPKTVLIQERVSPKTVLIQEPVGPKTVHIQEPITKTVLIQNGVETVPRQMIVRNNELPKGVMVDNNDLSLRMVQRKGQVLAHPENIEFSRSPQNKVLVRDNMFMSGPAPLPSSASMISGGLPSARPQPRGQFSRKFPIPPPTL